MVTAFNANDTTVNHILKNSVIHILLVFDPDLENAASCDLSDKPSGGVGQLIASPSVSNSDTENKLLHDVTHILQSQPLDLAVSLEGGGLKLRLVFRFYRRVPANKLLVYFREGLFCTNLLTVYSFPFNKPGIVNKQMTF